MGLFTSVIHVYDKQSDEVCKALAEVVPTWDFKLKEQKKLNRLFTDALPDELLYVVSPLRDRWTTIMDGHFAVEGAPGLSALAKSLSSNLHSYCLALNVHDDDILFYNLCQNGADLDGYNSSPLYFETARLPDDEIERQRHDPQPFTPLLPAGVTLTQLEEILDRGWWSAWKRGAVDSDGMPTDDNDNDFLGSEADRMIALGELLQLNGADNDYPFSAWRDEITDWKEYVTLRFDR